MQVRFLILEVGLTGGVVSHIDDFASLDTSINGFFGSVIIHDALFSQPVNFWGGITVIAIVAKAVSSKSVDHDVNYLQNRTPREKLSIEY